MAPVRPMRRVASDLSLEDTDLDGGGTAARRSSSGGWGRGGGGGGATRTAKKHPAAVRAPQAPSVGGSNIGDGWASWQDTVRAQEADRVRQYQSTFVADVTTARRAAVASLRRREEKRAKADAAYLQRVRDACGEALTETAAPAAAESHPLHAAGREVLDVFQALLARYERANEALQSTTSGHTSLTDTHADWAKDRAEARKLLQYGRVYGDSLVHAILVPGTADPGGAAMGWAAAATASSTDGNPGHIGDSGNATAGVLNQTGRSALGLFPRSQAAVASGETWGAAARTQIQALTGLVKTLPGTEAGVRTNAEAMDWNWETKTASGSKSVSFSV